MTESKTFCDACGVEITRRNDFSYSARVTLVDKKYLMGAMVISQDLCRNCGKKVYNFLTGKSKGELKK